METLGREMLRKGLPSKARQSKAVAAPVRSEGTIPRPRHASSRIRLRRLPGRCRAQYAMCKEGHRTHQSRPSPTTKAAIAALAKVNSQSPNKCPTGLMAEGQWASPADCSSSVFSFLFLQFSSSCCGYDLEMLPFYLFFI